MIVWIEFLKELEVAAAETGMIVQSYSSEKNEQFYQEELDLE